MPSKWIALGLFVAGLCLILGAGLLQLKHIAMNRPGFVGGHLV